MCGALFAIALAKGEAWHHSLLMAGFMVYFLGRALHLRSGERAWLMVEIAGGSLAAGAMLFKLIHAIGS